MLIIGTKFETENPSVTSKKPYHTPMFSAVDLPLYTEGTSGIGVDASLAMNTNPS